MAKTAIWPSRLIFLEDLPRELEAHQGELRLAMPCAWRRPRESTASHAFRMHAPRTHPPREWREFFGRLTRPHQLITLVFEVHQLVEPGRDRVARVEQGRARVVRVEPRPTRGAQPRLSALHGVMRTACRAAPALGPTAQAASCAAVAARMRARVG